MNKITEQRERTRARLLKHYQTYPKLQTEDIFKYIFQSAFGCEHLVSNEDTVLAYIKREYAALKEVPTVQTDILDGVYTRVYLSCLNNGITPETLAKLFCLSAKKEPGGKTALEEKIDVVKELIADGELPLNRDDFERKLAVWRADGYPAVHHSETFRSAYHPAYRVIANRYAEHLHIFSAIDKQIGNGIATVAIKGTDGTALADILREVYGQDVMQKEFK